MNLRRRLDRRWLGGRRVVVVGWMAVLVGWRTWLRRGVSAGRDMGRDWHGGARPHSSEAQTGALSSSLRVGNEGQERYREMSSRRRLSTAVAR